MKTTKKMRKKAKGMNFATKVWLFDGTRATKKGSYFHEVERCTPYVNADNFKRQLVRPHS